MKVKCYKGNYDGTRESIVIAPSWKIAANVAQSSLYEMHRYWSIAVWDEDANGLMTNKLYTRRMCSKVPWFQGVCP